MKIIGFNFTKISVERLEKGKGEIKINTEIDIPEIKQVKPDLLKTKDEVLEAKFLYRVKYEPNFAKLEFEGKILLTLDPKLSKEVLKQWKKKNLPEDFRIFLFNVIMKKSTLKALSLEDELNLPLHMPLPSFRRQK